MRQGFAFLEFYYKPNTYILYVCICMHHASRDNSQTQATLVDEDFGLESRVSGEE